MTIRARVKPSWPVIVAGEGGVIVTQSGGRATIGFDYDTSQLGAELQQAVDTANSAVTTAAASATSAASSAVDAAASAGSLIIATQPQAEEGAINDHGMSPLRVQQSKLGVQTADSLTTAAAVNIATIANVLMAYGNTDPGDNIPAPYVSRLSNPDHAGKTQINGVWYELERHDGVYLEDFGGINALQSDGSISTGIDNSTALADAIDYCVKKRRNIIRATPGVFPFTQGNIEFPVGISLIGAGHSSSTTQGGSVFQAVYNETTTSNPFLHFTGDGAAFNATGGGLQSITIQKGINNTGGTLLKITGVDDSNRPGYMSFRDIRLSGTNGTSNCDYCSIVDGSNLNTANTNGIRDVTFSNVFIDGWAQEGSQFINATHAKLIGFTASPTDIGGVALRISGDSSVDGHKTIAMTASNLDVFGTVVLDRCHQCVIVGRMTDLTITGECTSTIVVPAVENPIGFSSTDRSSLRNTNKTIIFDGQDDALYTNNTKVVGTRVTGFTAPTGTSYKGAWDPSTIVLLSLAQRVKAIEDAVTAHGLIGA